MSAYPSDLTEIGLDITDLLSNLAFAARRVHTTDIDLQMQGLRRLTRAFVDDPDTILQELVNAAITLCGAESAGISILRNPQADRTQQPRSGQTTDDSYYQWIATAGKYAPLLNATLPHHPSPCGICMERNRPQLFRITPRFFAMMGMEPDTITDGILLPWRAGLTEGTLWIMSHQRAEAFDTNDLRIMQTLVDFAVMAIRHEQLQLTVLENARSVAAKAMANNLAHQLNNPLQSVTNLVYLASIEKTSPGAEALADSLTGPLDRLSHLVANLLVPPPAGSPHPQA